MPIRRIEGKPRTDPEIWPWFAVFPFANAPRSLLIRVTSAPSLLPAAEPAEDVAAFLVPRIRKVRAL